MSCSHTESRWVTRTVKGRAADVRICDHCGKALSQMGYRHLPTRPLVPNRCANCGASRTEQLVVAAIAPGQRPDLTPVCTNCNISRRKDRQVHFSLTRKLGAEGLAEGASQASQAGRHTLALKLATASFHFEDNPVLARSIRIQELESIGEGEVAEREGLNWLADPSAPALVGGLVGDILLRHGKPDEALTAMTQGLERDPDDRYLRLERAEVLGELECFDDAVPEAVACLEGEDPISLRAIELLERVADHYFVEACWDDIREIFRAAAPLSHSSADLCYMQACAEIDREKNSEARKWLLRTLQLDEDRDEAAEALEALEQRMGLAHSRR